MAKNKIPKITLSDKAQLKLVSRLEDMIEEAEEFHGAWEDLHNIYLNQYLCKPAVDRKLSPWPGASNFFAPVGRVIQDGVISQLHDAMWSNDPFMKASGVGAKDQADAELLSIFYSEYVYKKLINLRQIGNDWNFLTCLDGTGAIKIRYNKELEILRNLQPRTKPVIEKIREDVGLGEPMVGEVVTGYEQFYEEVVESRSIDKPAWDVVDMANLYMAPQATQSLQREHCPWYYEVMNLTWDALVARRERMSYDNVDEQLQAQLGRRELTVSEITKRESEELGTSNTLDTLRVLEFYVPIVLPAEIRDKDGLVTKQTGDKEGGLAEDCIVTYYPDTQKIARIVPISRIYPDGKRPHILNWYNRIPLLIYGQGIQSKSRQMNEMINSSFNQMMDYGSLVNKPWFFYVPALTGVLPDIMTLAPGAGIAVNDASSVNIPRLQSDVGFWMSSIQQLQQYAERDGNVNDFTIGRNPEQSANKTARGAIALLQQGQLAFGRIASLMIQSYEEAFSRTHNLVLRNFPDEMFFKATEQGATGLTKFRMTREILSNPDWDFQFVLNPNRMGEQQVNQSMFQLMSGIPYIQQNPAAVRALAKQLYDSTGKKNFDEIWPEEMTYQIQQHMAQQQMQQQGPPPGAEGQPQGGPPPPSPPGMQGPPPGMPMPMMGEPNMGVISDMLSQDVGINEPLPELEEEELGVTLQ